MGEELQAYLERYKQYQAEWIRNVIGAEMRMRLDDEALRDSDEMDQSGQKVEDKIKPKCVRKPKRKHKPKHKCKCKCKCCRR